MTGAGSYTDATNSINSLVQNFPSLECETSDLLQTKFMETEKNTSKMNNEGGGMV